MNEDEVGVSDDGDIDDELADLDRGQVLFPPDTDLEGGHSIIVVHKDVNPEVEDDGYPLRGRMFHQLVPSENEGSTMMVSM